MILNYKVYIFLLVVAIFNSACNDNNPKPNVKQTKSVSKKTKKVKEVKLNVKKNVVDKNISVIKLTPIQKCKHIENKFNLIVSAPKNSKIRILNIKEKYKNCIVLERGKYNIEVSKKGYFTYKRWIGIGRDVYFPVTLVKKKKVKNTSEKVKNKKILKPKKYSKSLFKGYSPHSEINSNACIGFYPSYLVESMLNISTPLNYWDNITWSGKCKNGLMYSRGVLYFKSKAGLHVELKGKMKDGFFNGKVYNFSSFKKKPEFIIDTGSAYYNIKLNTIDDYKEYQE